MSNTVPMSSSGAGVYPLGNPHVQTLRTNEPGTSATPMLGSDSTSTAVRKVRSAADQLRSKGVEVPQVLADALANLDTVRKVSEEPTAPSPGQSASKFSAEFEKYVKKMTEWNAKREAQQRMLDTVTHNVIRVAKEAANELFPSLADRFNNAAREYTENWSALESAGASNLIDAASADESGDLVRSFHKMQHCATEMTFCVNAIRAVAGAAWQRDSWHTENMLALVASFPAHNAMVLVNSVKTARRDDARYHVLLSSGYPLKFARSLSEWSQRMDSTEIEGDDFAGVEIR